jgi:hypothetical protein
MLKPISDKRRAKRSQRPNSSAHPTIPRLTGEFRGREPRGKIELKRWCGGIGPALVVVCGEIEFAGRAPADRDAIASALMNTESQLWVVRLTSCALEDR